MSGVKYLNTEDTFQGTTPAGGLASGDVVFDAMERCGIVTALSGFAEGQTYAAVSRGRFQFPAKTTDTWAAGDLVYWDSTNKELTSTSVGNKVAGKADVAKTNGQTTNILLLNNHGKSA